MARARVRAIKGRIDHDYGGTGDNYGRTELELKVKIR